jgi:hypothetical protein
LLRRAKESRAGLYAKQIISDTLKNHLQASVQHALPSLRLDRTEQPALGVGVGIQLREVGAGLN